MGKQPAGAAAATSGAANRKRSTNESGQPFIAAAFQAAKRPHHTNGAGKSNTTGPVAPDTTQLGSDQDEKADGNDAGAAELAAAAAAGAGPKGDPLPHAPGATPEGSSATTKQQQQQQQQQEADPSRAVEGVQQEKQPPAAKQQQRGKAAAKKEKTPAAAAAAAARKPRAAATKAAAAAQAATAAAKADAGADAAESEEEAADDDEAGEAAAAGPAGAAAAAAAAESASFDAEEVAQVQQSLLAWYDRVQRVLPWRRNPHHKPQQQQQNPATQPPPAATAAAAAAAAAEDRGSGSSSGKQKKPSKKQLAAAAEAEAALAAAKPAPAELPPQEFAYYVWVSEIMLQQTQVSRVVTYFNKWIAAWPTVTALAAASQEEVNEVWAGLGYYRRARYLLEGAQHIVNTLGGKFPETAAELRQIPGVGPYTAAAVASIAFNDAAAAVDGNVIRVLARMRALKGNPAKMTKTWDNLAVQLLHPERPGCHNQAMMELGATVCKPVNPSCGACPVSSCCTAYKLVAEHAAAAGGGGSGDMEDAPRVTDFPEKVAKAAKAEQQVAVCVLKVLLLPGADTPAAVAAAAAAAGSAQPTAAAAAGKGSIRSFFKPAPKQQQQQCVACEAGLLAAGAAAHYLLVQRPETGVLAGLWEFPGVVIDCEPTPTARRTAVDGYLAGRLGVHLPNSSSINSSSSKRSKGSGSSTAPAAAEAGVHVVQRRQLGSLVHIFSHIRQSLHAEELVLLAPSLEAVCCVAAAAAAGAGDTSAAAGEEEGDQYDAAAADCSDEEDEGGSKASKKGASKKRPRKQAAAAGARPALRWVAAADMVQAGLTSGVRKVFNLSVK